jgi:uncharacterized protein HemX
VILWYALLVLFGFLSMLIDLDYMRPQIIFRQLWNLLILATGLYLLIRMRIKARQGALEGLQQEYERLSVQREESRYRDLEGRLKGMEDRLRALEGKK